METRVVDGAGIGDAGFIRPGGVQVLQNASESCALNGVHCDVVRRQSSALFHLHVALWCVHNALHCAVCSVY